jgi:hypothetical protein
MRSAPPPRRARRDLRVGVPGRARQGAVQPSTVQPSMSVLSRGGFGPSRGPSDYASREEYRNLLGWQAQARNAGRNKGVARFAANMVAATAARVILQVEEQNELGDWNVSEQANYSRLMDQYGNDLLGQGPAELVRLHTWHYQISGEGHLVNRDRDYGGGSEWLVASMPAVQFDAPKKDLATVWMIPGGNPKDGTAFVVPREQVVHFWMPDEDWLAYAVSPMTAAMNDLARHDALARYAQRQAHNYLAMNGVLWTPSVAHEGEQIPTGDGALDSDGEPASALLKAYEEMARTSINDVDDSTLESVLPPMWWWENEVNGGGPPQWMEVGRPLDEHGIAYRAEALADFARDVDVPSSLVTGGGSDTESNHWQAWMTKDRFIATVAPVLDRVTHQDLTVSFLHPLLRILGVNDVGRYRVGYDPLPVIKEPAVKIDEPIRAWLAGLLGAKPALEKMGYDADDLADDDDLKRLAAVLSNFAQGVPPSISGPDAGPAGPALEGPPQTRPDNPVPVAALTPGAVAAEMMAEYMPVPYPRPALDDGAGALAAAALNPVGQGIMLALDVPVDVAETFAREDGEPVDAMHVTLIHYPAHADDPDLPAGLRNELATAAAQCAAGFSPPTIDLSHVERFVSASGEPEPVVLVDDGPDVYAIREKLAGLLDEQGVGYSDDHGFRCHVTIGYYQPGSGPRPGPLSEPVIFTPSGITLHWGAEVVSYPFASGAVEATICEPLDVVRPAVRVDVEELGALVDPVEVGIHAARLLAAAAGEGLRAEIDAALRAEQQTTKRLLTRIARIRRDAGRALGSAAELTLAAALRQVGVRAKNLAKNKSGQGLAESVTAAMEQGTSLRPFFATLGVDDERLLAGSFDEFRRQAEKILAGETAELDAVTGQDSSKRQAAEAAVFLAAVLLYLARRRILDGAPAHEAVGEVSGAVPAAFVSQAVGIAEGRLAPIMPDHPDVLPTVHSTDVERAETVVRRSTRESLIDRLTADRAAETDPSRVEVLDRAIEQATTTEQTTYVWTWGYWSTPDREFEPHYRLDGTETTEPETDPAFMNDNGWPDGEFFQPQDHDGCSCELVPLG